MPTTGVTVILCMYNGEKHVDEAIWSVRNQTYREWRLIIVDDGSTDASLQIALGHAAQDERIQVLQQANAGVRAARNMALGVAQTRWVALLDHDDVYLPEKLQRQMAFLERQPHLAALGTHGYRIGQSGQRLGYFDVGPRDESHFQRLFNANNVIYLLAASVVFDRELALRVGGFPELQATEDVGLWSRMADHAPIVSLAERLVAYRVHAGSTSGRKMRTQRLELESIRRANEARRAGRPEPTFAEFMQQWNEQPEAARRAFDRESDSLNAYRIAGGLLADRRPAGVLWLARSVILNPRGRMERIFTQLDLKRRVRRWAARAHDRGTP